MAGPACTWQPRPRRCSPSTTSRSRTARTTASSSRAPYNEISYAPGLVLDGRPDTAWIEGADDAGIGETITLSLSEAARVARIRIQPGYFKSPSIWSKNNRIARATIVLSDGRTLVADFDDANREQAVRIGGGPITWIENLLIPAGVHRVINP